MTNPVPPETFRPADQRGPGPNVAGGAAGWAAGYGAPGSMPPMPNPVYVTAAPQRPEPRRGWIVALVAVILCFLFGLISLASCASVMGSAFSLASYGGDAAYATSDSIAIIPISGTIDYNGTNASPEGLRDQLDRAAEDPLIKAVVLRVNSGGGSATAGEEMAAYVRDFEKPVVVSSAAMNASAAYEVSSQADFIYTAKSTSIGSIGTVMQLTDLSGLLNKLGITVDNIASADSKDSSYGMRPLTEEERAYYQAMVDQINDNFIETVAEGRSMDVAAVRALATGLAFTGVDAVENGLADEIGLLEDAVAKAGELAGITDPATIYLTSSDSSLASLLDVIGRADESAAQDDKGISVTQ